jgi:hypothetical protein
MRQFGQIKPLNSRFSRANLYSLQLLHRYGDICCVTNIRQQVIDL